MRATIAAGEMGVKWQEKSLHHRGTETQRKPGAKKGKPGIFYVGRVDGLPMMTITQNGDGDHRNREFVVAECWH
jgi:hypothetical protein